MTTAKIKVVTLKLKRNKSNPFPKLYVCRRDDTHSVNYIKKSIPMLILVSEGEFYREFISRMIVKYSDTYYQPLELIEEYASSNRKDKFSEADVVDAVLKNPEIKSNLVDNRMDSQIQDMIRTTYKGLRPHVIDNIMFSLNRARSIILNKVDKFQQFDEEERKQEISEKTDDYSFDSSIQREVLKALNVSSWLELFVAAPVFQSYVKRNAKASPEIASVYLQKSALLSKRAVGRKYLHNSAFTSSDGPPVKLPSGEELASVCMACNMFLMRISGQCNYGMPSCVNSQVIPERTQLLKNLTKHRKYIEEITNEKADELSTEE